MYLLPTIHVKKAFPKRHSVSFNGIYCTAFSLQFFTVVAFGLKPVSMCCMPFHVVSTNAESNCKGTENCKAKTDFWRASAHVKVGGEWQAVDSATQGTEGHHYLRGIHGAAQYFTKS